MSNGFYSAVPPQHSTTQHGSKSTPQDSSTPSPPFIMNSYLERPREYQTNDSIPPPIPRLPPSLVTDRLNWRRDEDEDPSAGTSSSINPSDFYRRVPAAQPSESSPTSSPDAGSSGLTQPGAAGFYPFTVSSSLSSIPNQHVASPTQYSQRMAQPRVNGMTYNTNCTSLFL